MTSNLLTPPPQVQSRREEEQEERPPPPAPPPGRSVPAFYFPRGRPQPRAGDVDDVIADVERAFAKFLQERAGLDDMGAVAKVGGFWARGRVRGEWAGPGREDSVFSVGGAWACGRGLM